MAARHGVLFVHGVGSQRQSDTLLDFGGALLACLKRWYAAQPGRPPRVQEVNLSFAPVDPGEAGRRSRAMLRLWGGSQWETWICTEAWWASSNRRPDVMTMLNWSFSYLLTAVLRLIWAAEREARRLAGMLGGKRRPEDPALWAQMIELIYTPALALLYLVGGLLGYAVLLPLIVLSRIPVPAVQDFILFRLIQPFLEVQAGEFRTYLVDDLQAANMHRRVAEGVTWLVTQGCDEVTIVAHSEGAVVSFGMLTDPDPRLCPHRDRVTKLITIGAGLNKSWEARPDLARLFRTLPGHIHWLDLWTSYDPVPAGWLEPEQANGSYATIFAPDEALAAQQRLTPRPDPSPFSAGVAGVARYWPVSQPVVNEMSVLTDHGAYFHNDEQVLLRIAAEIDAPYHGDSRFWRGYAAATGARATRARQHRVALLAALRGVFVLAYLALIGRLWLELAAVGGLAGLGASLGAVALRGGLAGGLARLIAWLEPARGWALVGGLIGQALDWPFGALGPAVILLAGLVLYSTLHREWRQWDERARTAAVRALAG